MLPDGTVLAHRYRIRAPLGRGGAAHTYEADDLVEPGKVALKLLDPERPLIALTREFERARRVVHPHLAEVRELAVAEVAGVRRALYTMELVRGGTLGAHVKKVGLRAARIALGDVLAGLHALHRLGLRHGDVKPENVLVRESGRAVLIDLGCAAPLGEARATLSGTPGYLAPELRAGEPADERADLYAFGVMLGALGGAAAGLAPLIAQLTAEAPAARPSSAREVLAALGDPRDLEASSEGRASACHGRAALLARCARALVATTRGEPGPRCVWIEGAPGVGRSRVLRELAFALARDAIDVLDARALGPAPLREALARRHGPAAPGIEGLLDQLVEAGATPGVLVLDDAQRIDPDAHAELALAMRGLDARGRLGLLVASTASPPRGVEAAVLHVRLAALDDAAITAWATDVGVVLDGGAGAALARFSGGSPRYLERALGALASGRVVAAQLATLDDALDDASARSLDLALAGLDDDARRALAEAAVRGSVASPPATLFARDLLARREGNAVLAREADRTPLLRRLDARTVRRLQLVAARACVREGSPEALARAVAHFADGGRLGLAQRWLARAGATAERAPRAFARLADLDVAWTAEERIVLARMARLAGDAPGALRQLARARRAGATGALLHEAAETYLALGRPARAARMLGRAGDDADPSLRARVWVRRGAYAEARSLAAQARNDAPAEARAALLEAEALAAAYLGAHDDATALLATARTLHAEEDLRARARGASLRGFVALRAGDAAAAAQAYEEAFTLADAGGLADLTVNALANLASARQSLGRWGSALASYERALRLAGALGRDSSVHSLRANLANLAIELGAFDRAAAALDALEATDTSAALRLSIALYRAELSLLTGDARGALARVAALAAAPETPARERIEAAVLEAHAHLQIGEPRDEIVRAEARLAALSREGLAADLAARLAEVEARMRIAAGAPRDALPALEAARERLGARDDPALRARVDGALAEVYDALASGSLARAAAERALARWERIALDLPPSLRDAFWAHPHRRRARGARERPGEGRATLSLSRVRELNRRLSALHTQGEVLAFALDAAIELTGAERGFVLLRKDRGFEVAIAEQMDRTRMPKSAWKWSRSIAERVIGDGEPVLTVDAERDPRFRRNESVHAMHLKSVLCAPIRARGGILGALYLDNRLARARFSPDDAELLLSFADQVAIALTHAALVSELAQKARELAREKRKVELLARGQAREIERLEGVVSAQREQLGVRHSFADIVGRSEPMRRVLRVLDRVIDTDLSVLVQGESGTGKELIARALHRHGRRAERPFVSVNCAAIPAALLESELFGHVKGAFTGALSAREGLFATARSGTIFLDELGELPLPMQAKLLRVLQDGEVRPVGANKSFAVDVRVVCATNRDLKQRVSEGAFREDLFYRVSVVEIALPALRERHDDIVPIAEAILKQRAEALGEAPAQLAPDAVRALLSYGWPGNVRELQNVLLRASVMARAGAIGADDLDLPSGAPRVTTPRTPRSRDEFHRREAERLLSALSAERWNVSKVAKNLGMPRNTLYRKLARYGIQRTGKEQQQ